MREKVHQGSPRPYFGTSSRGTAGQNTLVFIQVDLPLQQSAAGPTNEEEWAKIRKATTKVSKWAGQVTPLVKGKDCYWAPKTSVSTQKADWWLPRPERRRIETDC